MIGTIQMFAGLAVVMGIAAAIVERRLYPLYNMALPGLIVFLILGWLTDWQSPDY